MGAQATTLRKGRKLPAARSRRARALPPRDLAAIFARCVNQRELNTLLAEWIIRLRLANWRISAELVNALGDDADINIDRQQLTAQVRLARKPTAGTVEENLVHELLHIPIGGFENPDETSRELDAKEAHINVCAEAFVSLKYAKPPAKR